MVVPDYELIAEIMLVAEGFIDARILARKFLTLYTLCTELLSKQDHYDWGLRAIKSVLVVAGALKRGDRGRPEDQVTICHYNMYLRMYTVCMYGITINHHPSLLAVAILTPLCRIGPPLPLGKIDYSKF